MAEATEQAPAAPQKPTCAKKKRKLTMQDVEAICKLVATRRLTETESCLKLGIEPKQWWIYKDRKKVKTEFDAVLSRIRAESINNCLDSIDEAGDSQTIIKDGKVIQRPGDWRAKAWLAERVLAPDRFGQQPEQQQQPTISISIVTEALKRVYGGEVRQIGEEKKLIAHTTNSPVIDVKPLET